MSQFKKCEVIMLPTNEEATIHSYMYNLGTRNEPRKTYKMNGNDQISYAQHLYILSNDEIKEEDWCYDKILNTVFQADEHTDFEYINQTDNVLKIIASSNKSLSIVKEKAGDNIWTQQLPQPSQSFIEAYIKAYIEGNPITEVMVEYEEDLIKVYDNLGEHPGGHWEHNPINNGIKLKVAKDNTVTIRKIKDSFNLQELENALVKHYIDIGSIKGCNLGEDVRVWTKKWIADNL